MQSPTAAPDSPPPLEVSVQDAVAKVVEILGRAHGECVAAQGVVELCMRDEALSTQDMQSVQTLDVATQTVEAATLVLQNLLTLMGDAKMPPISVARLSAGVSLHDIVRTLKGEKAPTPAIPAGDIDLF
ncbi:hypothetical protein K2X14_06410 [Acetobacter sp. TBRC 12305]|uniref:Uncharacterized protein n=1 Tax=Acetobacter garciniae TaxID=2817435 RepID=A0A939HN70_9PROT|nr:hypothetical protein [Acetobacter garciniae]MBO1324779.1 hypothetical protein [Acetobacter garciniae]MBX0344470.1 hypothetical protein [Acetobacter garciniae]